MSGPLMPCLEPICMALFNDVNLHLIFSRSLQRSDASLSSSSTILKSSYFLHYFTLLYNGDWLQK